MVCYWTGIFCLFVFVFYGLMWGFFVVVVFCSGVKIPLFPQNLFEFLLKQFTGIIHFQPIFRSLHHSCGVPYLNFMTSIIIQCIIQYPVWQTVYQYIYIYIYLGLVLVLVFSPVRFWEYANLCRC